MKHCTRNARNYFHELSYVTKNKNKNRYDAHIQYKVPPWAHQQKAIDTAKELDEYALFFEMGTGKTSTCINILRHKYAYERRLMRTLILCPPIVIDNWRKEFAMHSQIKDWDVIPLVRSQKERCETMRTFGFYHDRLTTGPADKIFITNYESLLMLDLLRIIYTWKPEILVLDESHRCKDPKSKRTKVLMEMAPVTTYRYLLTGTPILNSVMDIYAQFAILDKGKTFGNNFFSFRAKYFYDKNSYMHKSKYFPDWQPNAQAAEQINELIQAKSMRVTKAECLDLPPLVTQNIFVELTKEQQRLYDDMKTDFVAYLGKDACVANIALTRGLRLMQIASGFIKLEGEKSGDPSKEVQITDNPRAKALQELLSEITPHSKVLVWAVFKENYATIRNVCDALKLSFVEVHGVISAERKQENVRKFNEDPKCRVLIGHPGSGGIGINLVAASYAIFYSRNFSLEQDLQAEARNHRGGSEIHAKVTRINLIAKNTIDEYITEALSKKVAISEKVLQNMAFFVLASNGEE